MYRCLKPIAYLLFFTLVISESVESADAQVKNIQIRLSYKSKLDGNFNVKKFKLNHPLKIPQKEIINHLVSLRYKGTFLGNKEEPLFSSTEVQTLAPILFKEFKEVIPGKIIRIQLKSVGGITSGDIFSFKKYLNWRFDSIRGETFLQKNNVRGWNIFSWKMIPKESQLYFKSRVDKRIQKNWIVSKLKIPISDHSKKSSSLINPLQKESLRGNISPKLEEKLKHLKYLYDEELINEEEYKNQKKKIFEELF